MRSFGRVALFLGLWVCFLVAEKNASTLGLESFLGGEAGEAGEIELAKIRIANLLAQKVELEQQAAKLEREGAELEAKRKEREANLVSADDPEVILLLKQIDELKAQIAKLSAENSNAENSNAENSRSSSALTKNPAELQGEYIK
ncbi:MAG: hypothetical protein PUI79_01965 [Campylobacteraceae bacterium]|nr:hypothetical protein [Campylobacteraceae bacterium]